MKDTKRIFLITGIVLFTAYFFIAARTVPRETVLIPRWISSIDSGDIITMPGGPAAGDSAAPEEKIPFRLGDKFGYIDRQGNLLLNRTLSAKIALSGGYWAEYEAEPDRITVNDNSGGETITIENPQGSPLGYPFFLDNKIFLFGIEQNVISEIDMSGSVSWTCEFPGPVTCIDSAAGLVLAGLLDGIVEVLDAGGKLLFSFEPGGSLYPVIAGCAISSDGRRIALVSGVEDQRFLLLERFGIGDYKVVYHEFLGTGFRGPVHVTFTKDDRWVIFERSGGLGVYEAGTRHTNNVFLTGDVYAIDSSGSEGMIFVVVSHTGDEKDLVGIKLPGTIMIELPFKSADAFIDRIDSRLFAGGGQAIISFDLEKK